MRKAHKEVPVKVTAWVDAGVADLVSALSDIPGIETLDSCEDDNGEARVYFRFHGSAWKTVCGVHSLAKAIGDESFVFCQVALHLEYRDSWNPIARIAVPPELVGKFASAIRRIGEIK